MAMKMNYNRFANNNYRNTRYCAIKNDSAIQPRLASSRGSVSKPVAVDNAKKQICSSSSSSGISRCDMLKFINNREMPTNIQLPASIVRDCIEMRPVDLSFLMNKNDFVGRVGNNCNNNINNRDIGKDLNWKLGEKITKLVHHDNGYVVPKMRLEMDKDDLLVFERSMKTVLNKMTPENFETCILEIRQLDIKEEEKLNSLVDQVFSKAIQEESYSKIYSQLVSKFSGLSVNGKNFRCLLLNKCQQMFKKPLEEQIDEVKKFWDEKIMAEQNERMKVMYQDSIEEQIKKVNDKYFRNIRFISELYLQNEIPDKIIIHVIESLLSKEVTDSISLEAVCRMFVVIGKKMESKNTKNMEEYMLKIKELSVSKELGMKMRFKLKDIIDMKNRNWELRQIQMLKTVEPKTLKELEQEEVKVSQPKIYKNQRRF